MRKRNILKGIIFFSALSNLQISYAQKEANWWYFSWQVSVDFNSGVPVTVNNSAIAQPLSFEIYSEKIVNVRSLAPGFYFIEMEFSEKIYRAKFVKQ